MRSFLRFSLVGFFSVSITALLYVMMFGLLQNQQQVKPRAPLDINFSFKPVDTDIASTERSERPKKPERTETKPLPATPNLVTEKTVESDFSPSASFNNPSPVNADVYRGELSYGDSGVSGGPRILGGREGEIKTAIAPSYPASEMLKKTEGWVEVLISVNEFGRVTDVKVLEAYPNNAFNQTTKKGLRKWTFFPKTKDGKAHPFKVKQRIEFSLD